MKQNYRNCWHRCTYADRPFTYVEIPKAGCTTIKHQMSKYFKGKYEFPPVSASSELTRYMDYSRGPILENEDLVFTVVRDPIARMYSGIKMLCKIKHPSVPAEMLELYEIKSDYSFVNMFLDEPWMFNLFKDTHLTLDEYCIGNYLERIDFACSIEKIDSLEKTLLKECGAHLIFGHNNKADKKFDLVLTDREIKIILEKFGLEASYSLNDKLSRRFIHVIKYNYNNWKIESKDRTIHYG